MFILITIKKLYSTTGKKRLNLELSFLIPKYLFNLKNTLVNPFWSKKQFSYRKELQVDFLVSSIVCGKIQVLIQKFQTMLKKYWTNSLKFVGDGELQPIRFKMIKIAAMKHSRILFDLPLPVFEITIHVGYF